MIALILIGFWFNNLAKNNNFNQVVGVITGLASYFIGQFIITIIALLIFPELEYSIAGQIGIPLIGGVLFCLLARIILLNIFKNKKDSFIISNDILDDENFEI